MRKVFLLVVLLTMVVLMGAVRPTWVGQNPGGGPRFVGGGSTGFARSFLITTEPDSVKGSVDLIDYPMLVTAAHFPGGVLDADGLHPAANGGGGLRFLDAAGDSLPAEIVSFVTNADSNLATAEIYITVPTLSHDSPTVITCWYDTGLPAVPVANPTLGGQAVWPDYEAVFHLTGLTDATGNGYTGVARGSVPSTSGLAGGGYDFPVGLTNDILVASLDVSSIDGQFVLWANSDRVQIDFDPYFMSLLTSTPRFTMDPSGFPNIRSGSTSTTGTVDRENDGLWHCYTYSYQTSGTPNYQGYFDGYELVNNATAAEVDLTTTDLYLGNWRVSPSAHGWTGLLDEFRFRNSSVTQGWVQTECSNMRFPGDFAVGSLVPSAPRGLLAVPGDGAVLLSWFGNAETDFASYSVYRGTSAGNTTLYDEGIVPIEYMDFNATNDSTFFYTVTAFLDNGNESAKSAEVSATALASYAPDAPTGLTVESSGSDAYLEWLENTEPDLASYSLYRKIGAGAYIEYVTSIADAFYTDTSVAEGTAYTYKVTALDDFGNESGFSNEASLDAEAVPLAWLTFQHDFPDSTDGGTVLLDIGDAGLTTAGFVRPLFRRHDAAFDTTGVLWSTVAAVNWGAYYDSGVPTAGWNADLGGVDLTWSAGTGQDHYKMNMEPLGGAWVDVSTDIAGGATTYDHDATGSLTPPVRGDMRYRIYGSTSADSLSAVAVIDSVFYNQAVGVGVKFQAVKDTAAYHAGTEVPVETDEIFVVYTSLEISTPDTTPPDTTGVFAGVAVDTTSAANTILTLNDMSINEIGQVQFQWSNDGGSSYLDAEEWNPTVAATTVGDSIHTDVDMDAFAGATAQSIDIHTRFRLRDDEGTPNVSGWNVNQFAYARPAPAVDDTVGYGTIATDNNRDVDTNDNYAGKIVMPSAAGIVSGTWYIESTDLNFDIKMALYDTSNNLLATGTRVSASGTGWHTVIFDTPYAASASEEVFLMLSVDHTTAAGTVLIYFDNEENTPTVIGMQKTLIYTSFPEDPVVSPTTYTNRRFSAYVTFE